MDPFATARANFESLVDTFHDVTDLNEATTRFRIIDQLLQNCLGWPAGEINCERYHSKEYTDYELGSRSIDAIVEAKKEGVYFSLPAGLSGRRLVEIPTLLSDPDSRAAIEQVAGYCQKRGVPLGIVCNGHQLIAFFASRQDGPPLDGQALVFSSLDEMLGDFTNLWNYLSRDGVAGRNLQRLLLGMSRVLTPPTKLSDQIPAYPGFRARSSLETDLRILGGAFIQDIENEDAISEEFLSECYCNSGALSQYSLVSKEILKNRYDSLKGEGLTAVSAKDSRGLSPDVPADLMSNALTRRPLILLGDVGVGKSMFLKHLLKIEAADVLESAQVFYVNFGVEPAIETNLEEHVYKRIAAQLLENYGVDPTEASLVRAIYNGDLNRLKKTVVGELRETDPSAYRLEEIRLLSELTGRSASHLRRLLEHQRGTSGIQSVIVLDNIDQRAREFQDRVFVIAQSLAETWPTTIFVSLRPSTFYESKATGALAAYQLRVFTVSPTRVDEVVRKRLDYAKVQIRHQQESGNFPGHMSLSGDDLLTYIDVLRAAFTGNDELNLLLDNMSGGNLRVALTFLSNFVGSGYVSTARVLDEAKLGKTYTVPIHEFVRSMIFGEYDYFDPKLSEICNIFDVVADDGAEHFLLPMILAYVQHEGETAGGDAWVDLYDVMVFGQSLGFLAEQVAAQVERALRSRLLEPRPGKAAAGPFRITSVGAYMHREMIKSFSYLDAMVVDTPITDVHVRRGFSDVRPVLERLDRADLFLDYLDTQWSQSKLDGQSHFDWPVLSAAARRDIATARAKAERAAGRRRG